MALTVTFHGVRGSTPCHGPSTARYGGNTACVSLRAPGEKPVVLDLGTGLRYFGHGRPDQGPLDAVALVTHLHWDHVQGLPFFAPMLCAGARMVIHGPAPDDGASFGDAMRRTVSPPTFPVTFDDFPGSFEFRDVADDDFAVGGYAVRSRLVPHLGPTVGYRVEHSGVSVAYISDHQQPIAEPIGVPDGVRELAEGVDLLIHDAQYTAEEFTSKSHWGHCTAEYAIHVAMVTGARRLALFHHDPERTDDQLDAYSSCALSVGGLEVLVAREGLEITL